MRAALVDPNAPGHVGIQDVEEPVAAVDEAIVRVAATSLNQGEVRYAQSREPGSPIGWDLAGTIEHAAGDGSGPPAGARVVGFLPQGAWAEMAAVPTNALATIPDNVTFAQAATLPVAGLTALHVLERGSGLLGRKVLVTGANGGVGIFACRLARLMGAHVVGLIRKESYAEMVRKAGADEVVVSEDGSAVSEYGPFRLVAESVGGLVLANCLSSLGPDGICVTYGSSGGASATFEIGPFMRTPRARLYAFLLFNELGVEPASLGLDRLSKLVADGRLEPQITVEECWSRIGELSRDLLDRKIPGKAVLHIG